ncbi:MAG: leucine-rich repeat protein, partial [Prevotella sp.]|nr:leucine-rich repeat protein [Prevotella sp.]
MKRINLLLSILLTLLPLGAWAETVTIDDVTYSYDPAGTTATVDSIGADVTSFTINEIEVTVDEDKKSYKVTDIAAGAIPKGAKLRTLILTNEYQLQALNHVVMTNLNNVRGFCLGYGCINYYHEGSSWQSKDYFKVGDGKNGNGLYDKQANQHISILESVCGIPVTEIASNAFYGVGEYDFLTIPASIKTITDVSLIANRLLAINVDASSENFASNDGVLFDKEMTTLISYPQTRMSDYTVPYGVKVIGPNAFYNAKNLSGVYLPGSVTTIGQSAFQYAGADYGLTVGISSDSHLKTIGRSAFQESGLNSITLPDSLETIGEMAFRLCKSLQSINLPHTLTSIGGAAFINCENLGTLTFDTDNTYNGTTIGASAFFNCMLDDTIEIPEGVVRIDSKAFSIDNDGYGYSKLKNIRIPSTVTTLREDFVDTEVTVYRRVNLDFGTGTWATYYSNLDLNLPEGMTAYTITGVSGTKVETADLHYIPKEKPVLLQWPSGELPEWYSIPTPETIAKDANVEFDTNLFRGSTKETVLNNIHGDKYILSGDRFVKIARGTLPPFRCYIVVETEDNKKIDAPADYYTFNEGDGNSYVYKEDGEYIKKNVNIGEASLSVANGNATGTLTVSPKEGFYTYDIKLIRSVQAAAARAPQVDAAPLTLTPTVANADSSGVTTYTFAHVDDATYEVTVDFHKRINLQVAATKGKVEFAAGKYEYNGSARKPEIIAVTYGADNTLVDPKYYDVQYLDSINAGTGKIHIIGKRRFTGEFDGTFNIAQRDIKLATVVAVPDTLMYTGVPIEPVAKVTDSVDGKNIITTDEYEVKYKNNLNVGTATLIVEAKNKNYTSVTDITFVILPKNLTDNADLKITAIPAVKYTGEPFEPDLEIKDGNLILKNGKDYDVKYSNNVTVGTAVVDITFKGNYEGTAQTTFDILDDIKNRDINVEFADGSRWATYYWDEYLKVPDGLQAYVVEGHKEGSTELQLKQIDMIHANVGVLLYRAEGTEQTDGFKADTQTFGTT